MAGTRAARKFLRQFGESALSSDVLIYGSEASGTPEESMDAEDLQSISIWLDGWASAVFGDEEPTLEDFNSAFFVFCYQLMYLLRNGIPEWHATTEYFNNDYVKVAGLSPDGVDVEPIIYQCVVQPASSSSSVGDSPASSPGSWRPLNLGQSLNPQASLALGTRAVSTWVEHDNGEANPWEAIEYIPEVGRLVIAGLSGTHRIAYSDDKGATWTLVVAAAAKTWASLAYSPEKATIVSLSLDGFAQYSTDNGATWSSGSGIPANAWDDVKWIDAWGKWIAIASSGAQRIATSTDGQTWTGAAAPSAHTWNRMAFAPSIGRLVAVAQDGAMMYTDDGTTWHDVPGAGIPEANFFVDIDWSEEQKKFVCVSNTGTHRIFTSRDGLIWYAQTTSEVNTFSAVRWCREIGMWVVLSTAGTHRVQVSRDAATWTLVTAASAHSWAQVKWAPDLGIACAVASDGGGTSKVMVSTYVRKFIT